MVGRQVIYNGKFFNPVFTNFSDHHVGNGRRAEESLQFC